MSELKPNDLKPMAKLTKAEIRFIVFCKYNGKCAYCGIDLAPLWDIDHITPQVFGGTNDLENLNPSCKECNNYKCHTDLEGYRRQLHKLLNEKLDYLFKSKTKMQVAINMGSIKHTAWMVCFILNAQGLVSCGGMMPDPIPCPFCLHEHTLRARVSKCEPYYADLDMMHWHPPCGGIRGQVVTQWDQGWWECACGLRLPPFKAGILLDAALMHAFPNCDSIDAEGVHADTKRAWKGASRHA